MQLQQMAGAIVHQAVALQRVGNTALLMPAGRTFAEGGDEEVESLLQRVAEGVLPEDRREALQLLQDAITDEAKARHLELVPCLSTRGCWDSMQHRAVIPVAQSMYHWTGYAVPIQTWTVQSTLPYRNSHRTDWMQDSVMPDQQAAVLVCSDGRPRRDARSDGC